MKTLLIRQVANGWTVEVKESSDQPYSANVGCIGETFVFETGANLQAAVPWLLGNAPKPDQSSDGNNL